VRTEGDMTRARGRSGFSLIEMMISLAIAGIVLGAAYRLLLANQRFYRSQSVINDVQTNVREAALILAGEMREVSATGGDLQQMTDTAVTINAMRALGFVCSLPDLILGRVVVNNAALFRYRNIDPTRDSVFIFREGLVNRASDDRWLRGKISATTAVNCADGSAGTRVGMSGLVGGTFVQMDSVTIGAPVRAFETVNYRLYDAGSGIWWLGIRNYINGVWTGTQPIAGPMRPNDGVKFDYYDSTGTVTATAALVRSVGITVRGISTAPIQTAGRPVGRYSDSMTVRVAIRNN
jgi:prepilin-type N-terminal cleavage/methylation domain-containing protein